MTNKIIDDKFEGEIVYQLRSTDLAANQFDPIYLISMFLSDVYNLSFSFHRYGSLIDRLTVLGVVVSDIPIHSDIIGVKEKEIAEIFGFPPGVFKMFVAALSLFLPQHGISLSLAEGTEKEEKIVQIIFAADETYLEKQKHYLARKIKKFEIKDRFKEQISIFHDMHWRAFES